MKILFSLRHPFGLRNFEPVVRELAGRGHAVHLSFLTADKSEATRRPEELANEVAGVTWSTLPSRKDEPWLQSARRLRLLDDALRYRLPMYDGAEKLRGRAFRRLSPQQHRFVRLPLWRSVSAGRLLSGVLSGLDGSIPIAEVILADVRMHEPDLILVSPLVDFGSEQVDYVKAGRLVGVPSALVVNSWDNLTNKGMVRIHPDRIFVWNETQRDEATRYHRVHRDHVVVTGAPIFDRWFDRRPSRGAETFKECVGLDPSRPYILYLCSSPFIAEHELEFVERWIAAVRTSNPRLQRVGVLIRPHPENRQPWGRLEAAGLEAVSVWPPTGASPVTDTAASDYFDSIYHSDAVVGINSSGLIEAGIVGRPVLTVFDRELNATQAGTLHFRYLTSVGGGLLQVARSWAEHAQQLQDWLSASTDDARRASTPFVREFVRPHGLDVEATGRLVDGLVSLASGPRPRPRLPGIGSRATRFLLDSRLAPRSRRDRRVTGPSVGQPVDPRARIDAHLHALAESDAERLILGPWLGDLSGEVTYWLPFLGFAAQRLRRERLVAVSSGGMRDWYADLAAEYLDILDYFTMSELVAGRGGASGLGEVPASSTPFDSAVVRVVKQALGITRVRLLHPAFLAEWCRDTVDGRANLHEHAAPLPLPRQGATRSSSHVVLGLPEATKLVAPSDRLVSAIDALAAHARVVLAGPGAEPALSSIGARDRVGLCALDGPANRASASLVETLGSARAFVGFGSAFDLVAAQYGVPTVLLRSAEASDLYRVERASEVAIQRGGSAIETVLLDDPGFHRTLRAFAAKAARGDR